MAAFTTGSARFAAALLGLGVMIAGAYTLSVREDTHIDIRAGSQHVGTGELARVERVVDGDTIIVQRSGTTATERVRLIGIDTPELGHGKAPDECFANEATEILRALLPEGTEVELRPDPTQLQVDKYDRLLRHVHDTETGTNIVLALVEKGAGSEYTYDKPYTGQPEYQAAEANAQSQATGYWGGCPNNLNPRRTP